METRFLGNSGFKVPVLSLGTVTFGGKVEDFGGTTVDDARRIVDVCLDAGLNMFDSADGYAGGASEEILGQAIEGRRALTARQRGRRARGPTGSSHTNAFLVSPVQGTSFHPLSASSTQSSLLTLLGSPGSHAVKRAGPAWL